MITRKIAFNRRYLSNSNWHNLDDIIIQRENAVEWAKKKNATLLAPVDDETLQSYIEHYQDELTAFNQLYEESAKKVLEIRTYQKKLKLLLILGAIFTSYYLTDLLAVHLFQ